MNMLWSVQAEISGNLSRHAFSTGSGRIIPINCLNDYFYVLESQVGSEMCWFLFAGFYRI